MAKIADRLPVGTRTAKPDLARFGDRVARKLRRTAAVAWRIVRSWLAKAVYSLPFLTRHDPRRKVIKCKDHCRILDRFPQSTESIPEDWYLRVRPREILQRQPSLCLDESEATRFRAGTAKYQCGDRCEIPEVFVACIHDARIEGRDFLLLSREDQILFESALSNQEILEKNGILDRMIRPTTKKLSGTYALLAHPWAWGYYHWMIEVLPKLSLIEKFDDLKSVPLIVPHRLNAFQKDSLRKAGVSVDRMVHLDKGEWQAERLFFPEILGPSGSPSPHAVAWLRKTFLHHAPLQAAPTNSRIYLTRRDAPKRRVINEGEIIAFLQERGFVTVCAGDLPFAEQVEIFRNVRLVVSPHGAALTNMVFAPPGATLIEMFGDNYINGCYWALANLCGHRHAFLTEPAQALDYSVSVDRLDALLAAL